MFWVFLSESCVGCGVCLSASSGQQSSEGAGVAALTGGQYVASFCGLLTVTCM